MSRASQKQYISLSFLLVAIIVYGFFQHCFYIHELHLTSPDRLVGNIKNHSASAINLFRYPLGVQSHIHAEKLVHVKRSFQPQLHQNADDLLKSIKAGAYTWWKPEQEASWVKNDLPKDVMIDYGILLNSGATEQPHFLLSKSNIEHWREVPSIPDAKYHAIKTWFGRNIWSHEATALDAFDNIAWSARRAKSQQEVWWDWFNILEWSRKTPKWQSMINTGDLLHLEELDKEFNATPEEMAAIKIQLRNNLYEIEAAVKWNSFHAMIWGRYQVYEALSYNRQWMYNKRISQIAGPLGSGTTLEKQVAELGLEKSIEEIQDLELQWLLRGLDLTIARNLGKAIAIVQHQPSVQAWELSPTDQECIKNLESMMNQRVHRLGHNVPGPEQRWYGDHLGRGNYENLMDKLDSLYEVLIPQPDKKATSTWLSRAMGSLGGKR